MTHGAFEQKAGACCMEHWDPIGIRDEPNAQDEYDSYIGGVYDLLLQSATEQEIAAHLLNIMKEKSGDRRPSRGHSKDCARAEGH